MKLLSPALIHKTDAGAVVVGVKSHDQVRHTFHKLSTIPRMQGIPFEGILVQETLSGHEIIIGGKQDLQFGPVVLFGLGGIFVQILKDTSLRVAPIGEREAEEMIKEIKSYPVLAGARGRKAANIKDIAQMISAVSNLMYKENVSEMDLNPCFAGDECVAADLRIITKG